CLTLVASATMSNAQAESWKAGSARVAITPRQPIWMAGYASRTKPSEGAIHDLWAKALAIEDGTGRRCVLVTLDLCGIDRDLSLSIREALKERHSLAFDQVVIACSHTHSGPVVGTNLITMYPLDDDQRRVIEDYTIWLCNDIIAMVGRSIESLEPANLDWG